MNRVKRVFLLIGVLFNCFGGKAQQIIPNSSITESEKTQMEEFFKKRPLVLPQADLGFLSGYQNPVYKRRLDSLQKIVPMTYNRHVQGYIDLYSSKYKQRISKVVGLSKYYFPIFEKALKDIGIPDEIKFLTVLESSLDPHAVSQSGAKGLWQFMSGTAKSYGLKVNQYVDERKDPVQASYAAATYLKDTYKQFGDWLLAIAAYNCGASIVTKAIEKAGGIADFWHIRPYLPKQTQNYVPAFIATNYMMSYYKKYDIMPMPIVFNTATEAIQVNRVVSLARFAKAAQVDLNTLIVLNPAHNRQTIYASTTNPQTLVSPVLSKQVYDAVYEVLNTSEPPAVIAHVVKVKKKSAPVSAKQKVKHGKKVHAKKK